LGGEFGPAEYKPTEERLYKQFLAPVEQECKKLVKQKYGLVPTWNPFDNEVKSIEVS
jgi:hypothetical protein